MRLPRTVAILLYDGVNAVDVTGPSDAFAAVRTQEGAPGYALTFWSLDGGPVRAESGLTLLPDGPAEPECGADLLVVPGGRGVRDPELLPRLACWLAEHHARFPTVVSICTGAYALAEAGLLDGRAAATHWSHAQDLQRRYPRVRVDGDALFRRDGKFVTSGGVTAGIDLALELIAEEFGHRASARVAREMVVFTRRSGSQAQFSEPLRILSRAPDPLAEVARWAANHLDADLTVRALAKRACLSPRQFSRRFREAFGEPPAAWVRRVRVDGGRILLEQGVHPQKVAPAVGFTSVDGFRRAFQHTLGLTPGEYRSRFARREAPP